MKRVTGDIWIGLAFLAFAVFALALWIPADIESGIIEKVRRREKMGDALFPTAIAVAMVFVALLHLVLSVRRRAEQSDQRPGSALTYLAAFTSLFIVSFLLMRYVGPVAVSIFAEDASYRQLRDTVPYKYLGFATGGIVLVAGLITMIRGRMTLRAIGVAALAVIALIALYDLPFEDLLLPPNGDV